MEVDENGKETGVSGFRCPKCKFPVCDQVCKFPRYYYNTIIYTKFYIYFPLINQNATFPEFPKNVRPANLELSLFGCGSGH